MGIEKILSAKPIKIISRGNQFVRTKTVITPGKKDVARLTKDTLTINGDKVEILDIRGNMSPQDAREVYFKNLWKFYDPKSEKESAEMLERAFS